MFARDLKSMNKNQWNFRSSSRTRKKWTAHLRPKNKIFH
jgi:hypothetical protein